MKTQQSLNETQPGTLSNTQHFNSTFTHRRFGMKHSFSSLITGFAMVLGMGTTALAEDHFSVLQGIPAEAMTASEMDEVQGKLYTPFNFNRAFFSTNNFGGGGAQVFNGTAANLPNNCNYFGTCARTAPTNLTGTFAGSLLAAANVDPRTGQYTGGMTQGYSAPQVPTYNPYAQYQMQQQRQQYQYQQALAQARAIAQFYQGYRNSLAPLGMVGINLGCGRGYCP